MNTLTIIQPDDWHTHLRDGEALNLTVPHTTQRFARAIVMPNLKPPITKVKEALAYRERILKAVPAGMSFDPLMTLYLTEQMSLDDIKEAAENPYIYAFKLYPAGATTHSEAGVHSLDAIYPLIAAMESYNIPLLIHGEVIDHSIDIFDREHKFIEQSLTKLVQQFPSLRIVLEHITTKEAVDFITESPRNVAATITAHHLLLNRNDLFAGGISPHHYCLPILKRKEHQQALIKAAISENPKFFLGTDSAPHTQSTKETSHGCAGIYTAHAAIELYAEVFAQNNALDKLEKFASCYGPEFYGLPYNKTTITLTQKTWKIPEAYPFNISTLIPFRASETITWSLA